MAVKLTYEELLEANPQLGDFVLASAPPQMRIASLKAEDILHYFKVEERVAGLSLEERLVGLTHLTPEEKQHLAKLLAS